MNCESKSVIHLLHVNEGLPNMSLAHAKTPLMIPRRDNWPIVREYQQPGATWKKKTRSILTNHLMICRQGDTIVVGAPTRILPRILSQFFNALISSQACKTRHGLTVRRQTLS